MCKSVKSISKFKMLVSYNTETSSRLGNACAYFLCHKGDKVQGDHVHSCSKSRLRLQQIASSVRNVHDLAISSVKVQIQFAAEFLQESRRSPNSLTHTSKTRPSVKSHFLVIMFLLQICYSIQTLSFLRGRLFCWQQLHNSCQLK